MWKKGGTKNDLTEPGSAGDQEQFWCFGLADDYDF
jgi:hypothetical protein